MLVFLFFKQKTAYEMRISDWSSDVCSSDLSVLGNGDDRLEIIMGGPAHAVHPCIVAVHPFQRLMSLVHSRQWRVEDDLGILGKHGHQQFNLVVVVAGARIAPAQLLRSEERSVGKEWGRTCRFRWSPY